MTTMIKTLLVMAAILVAVASCGGGGSPLGIGNDEEIGFTSRPAPGSADLSGTLTTTGGFRAFSQAGSGLEGALVTLINTLTGGIAGLDTTDSLGKYEFKGVPSGDTYLLKIEFMSTEDLDGDGMPDEIELYFPIDLADQAIVELLEQIGIVDSDGDGQLDSIEVEVEINDDSGNHSEEHRQHNRQEGETRVDEDNDGDFDDENPIEDEDADGIPDASSSDDDGDDNSLDTYHELEIKGVIEAISETSITVGGTTFAINANTSWRIGDNRNADPAEFTVGMFVEAEGRPDGSGGWIADKVKVEDEDGDGEADDDSDSEEGDEREVKGEIEALDATSITVGGVTYLLTELTSWEFNDATASAADFAVGDYVEVEGYSDGAGGWIATEVEMEDGDDDGSDNDDEESDDGDESNDDDKSDDNDESDDDDESGDDDESDDDEESDDDDESDDDEEDA